MIEVEFHIAWSAIEQTAYVACYKVWFDGELISELTSDSGLKQPVISYLNYNHQALLCDDDKEYDSEVENPDFVSYFHERLNSQITINSCQSDEDESKEKISFLHQPIGFKGFSGALPLLGETLQTALELDDRVSTIRVHEILSDVVVAPLDNLLELLNDSVSIGPLRVIPDALHQNNPYPKQKDWYSGAAAWDVLGRSTSQIDEINHWLEDDRRLGLGYVVKKSQLLAKFPI
ncbi:hypothetical protein Q9290_14800 [Oceanimonas sp. CHS3-5]|uniref:hypothetical protein n=1 Tax=Oceanimonas sp. CHS3-5 TaxID=3068186 RepID=UPI00273EE74F|nr:hypothetical protein [Oceanimonas sp. CHS3-5]MDP5293551.1 hypothetical protein [Oceanimonas sp. CHS3-5]